MRRLRKNTVTCMPCFSRVRDKNVSGIIPKGGLVTSRIKKAIVFARWGQERGNPLIFRHSSAAVLLLLCLIYGVNYGSTGV